jgi:pimeloyl-ACP methyl ester carboxylesterase
VGITTLLAGLAMSTCVVACSDSPAADEGTTHAARTTTSPSAVASSAPTTSTAAAAPVDMYDVGGHKLYMSCQGTGSPTVVYVHGWVNDADYTPHLSALKIQELLSDDYRVCLYDRRNVGSSEVVDAVQTPADMLKDMEKVLRVGGTTPPYILMAASFGGLLAYSYLNHHPENVTGMVMIDTTFPDELRLDRYLPEQYRYIHYRHEDSCCTLERISQYDLVKGLQRYIGREPDVPLIYLASQQEPFDQNDYESPEYDARILDAQAGFVARFAPGKLVWVDAPHFMEPVVPAQIAEAVHEVAELAS